MKPFHTMVLLRAPPERMFTAMRDRIVEATAALPDIKAVHQLERSEVDGDILIVNRWEARQTLPRALQAKLDTDELAWIDRAYWNEQSRSCRWTIEPLIANGALTCQGSTRFEPAMAGRGARAIFEGVLALDSTFLDSLLGRLRSPATSLLESVATTVIPANFRAAAEAAAMLD
jgi:hypothetical protein